MTFDYCFGCFLTSPLSKYAWDGSLVVCKVRGDDLITIAIFENGKDSIIHPATYAEAVAKYKEYTEVHGWRVMNIDDLDNTSIDQGKFDKDTVLTPIGLSTNAQFSGFR